MRSGNNIHVQQHRTNMINEEWNKTQNDAPFIAFYDMRAVTFVLPDKMADVSIAGLQWLILIPRLNHTGSHRPVDSHSKSYLHGEKTNCKLSSCILSLVTPGKVYRCTYLLFYS